MEGPPELGMPGAYNNHNEYDLDQHPTLRFQESFSSRRGSPLPILGNLLRGFPLHELACGVRSIEPNRVLPVPERTVPPSLRVAAQSLDGDFARVRMDSETFCF